ncbi:MAG: hypothetical protein JOZ95_17590 [Solirubrobacterales bacterium]|nr:hypothetical protein [Solirubrobacterales bacterium]
MPAEYANDVLAEPDWLERHLDDEGIRIVEVDEDPTAYLGCHIPGAVGLDWGQDLQDPLRRAGRGAGLRKAPRTSREHRRPPDAG